jgi:hypothetical protein
VAKLDRLSRDVHFISGLMKHKVAFVVADLGADTVWGDEGSRMKGPFGIDDPKLYGVYPTQDGNWFVGEISDGKWMNLPTLYDSEQQAKEIADLLSAREMQRYGDELATVKIMPGRSEGLTW